MASAHSVREPVQVPSPHSKKDDSGVFSPRDVDSTDTSPVKGSTFGSNGHGHSPPLNGNGSNGHHDYSGDQTEPMQHLSYGEHELETPGKASTLPHFNRESASPVERSGSSLSTKPVPPPRLPKSKQPNETDFVAWVAAHGQDQGGAQGQNSPAMSEDLEKKKKSPFSIFKRSSKHSKEHSGNGK